MRDLGPDLTSPDADLVAEPACCPGGACGPIFETPLLELAFNRLRDFVGNRRAPAVVAAAPTDPPADQDLSTASAVLFPPPQPRKDASHD